MRPRRDMLDVDIPCPEPNAGVPFICATDSKLLVAYLPEEGAQESIPGHMVVLSVKPGTVVYAAVEFPSPYAYKVERPTLDLEGCGVGEVGDSDWAKEVADSFNPARIPSNGQIRHFRIAFRTATMLECLAGEYIVRFLDGDWPLAQRHIVDKLLAT